MSGFAGFYQKESLLCNSEFHYTNLDKMIRTQKHRKSHTENNNLILTNSYALASTKRIRTIQMYEKTFHILLCGELYNTEELLELLSSYHFPTDTSDDAQTILLTYLCFGEEAFCYLKGCFSFALAIEEDNCFYLVRDALGCKPVYYSAAENIFLFGTEPKALLAHPAVSATVDQTGIKELLFLGPAHTPGLTLFKNIREVRPGHFLCFKNESFIEKKYWELKTRPHIDNYEDTIEKTGELVRKAILQQAKPHSEIGCLLSGGIDSSIVTAVCANELKKHNIQLRTYSFDYEDNDTYFQSNSFQPSLDRPYVDKMVTHFETNHTYLSCRQQQLFDTLDDSLKAHDMPPMGDIDASLLFFCRIISPECQIVLTGECADEVFGGYPWFHREDLLKLKTFPWSSNLLTRTQFLNKELLERFDAKEYVNAAFHNATENISYLPGESTNDRIKRQNAYISLSWFGATLLNRMERCGASGGLIGRVPFADRDLVEYIYNVPWDMKIRDGVIKSLLREAFSGELPYEILYRKKSPFPKTYHPAYEALLRKKLTSRLEDSSCPLHRLIDRDKLLAYIQVPKDYTTPWYGQLMAGPQMLAYLLQIDRWMSDYHINII